MSTRSKYRLITWIAPAALVALAVATTVLAQGMAPAGKKAAPKAAVKAVAGMAAAPAAPAAPAISPADAKLELATVGDVKVTVGDLAERINRMSRYVRGRYQSLDKKRSLLDSMVEFEVLAKEAAKRGFAKHPDVVRMLRQVMIQRLRQTVVEDKVKRADIADKDVKAYYDKHKNQYNKPETVRVSHILLKDEATAKKVLAEVKAKGNDPRAFRNLVKKYSTDETTKRRAGDLRYFTRTDKRVAKEVVAAAFALAKRGDVAGPVKSNAGFHVLKLTHRRKAISRLATDPKVRQQIVTRILRERRRKALESFKKNLRAKATVKVFDDRLAGVKIDTTIRRRGGFKGRSPRGGMGAPGGRMRRFGRGMGRGMGGGMRRGPRRGMRMPKPIGPRAPHSR